MPRGFTCSVFIEKNRKLVQLERYACWSGINDYHNEEEIYVAHYQDLLTLKYQKRLIYLVNQITPCSFVERDGMKFIKVKLFKNYNQNLVVLNFIRNLWHEPYNTYLNKFFKSLAKSKKKYKDPLERLTWANKEACIGYNSSYPPGHSNVFNHNTLLIKTKKELLECTAMTSIQSFLCDIKKEEIKKYGRDY